MADTLRFELVSPERRLVSVEATHVQIPGVAGDFTAMPKHAPFLTTLRPGVVRVVTLGETTEYVVTGGFAEISPETATILAERAVPNDGGAAQIAADLVEAAEKAQAEASDELRLGADQFLRDARELQKRVRA